MEGQIEALVDHVNANGGVGGRDVEPVIEVFNALQDTPSKEEELCLGFTQDAEVFAVMLTGQFQENARPCYADAETPRASTARSSRSTTQPSRSWRPTSGNPPAHLRRGPRGAGPGAGRQRLPERRQHPRCRRHRQRPEPAGSTTTPSCPGSARWASRCPTHSGSTTPTRPRCRPPRTRPSQLQGQRGRPGDRAGAATGWPPS